MGQAISPMTQERYGLKRVCAVWGISRSKVYRQPRQPNELVQKRGPKPQINEDQLLEKIREDLKSSPFRGEGHRKVHARLRRRGNKVGRNRVLRVMGENLLLSPHRSQYKPPLLHDGQITTDAPNVMWGSDGTKVQTAEDGWVWIFSVADHWNSECMGYHVCKMGDRFAALEPIQQAVRSSYGSLAKDIAKGLQLRVDNGSQYTSDYFLQQLAYWGIQSSFGLVRQPETNGVAERFHRTLKEQIIEGRVFKDVLEVGEAVGRFVRIYNEEWLVAKRNYQSPLEARRSYEKTSRLSLT